MLVDLGVLLVAVTALVALVVDVFAVAVFVAACVCC